METLSLVDDYRNVCNGCGHYCIGSTVLEMRVQRQSEGFRHGNPEDHEQAVKNVIHFMQANQKGNWFFWKEWLEQSNKLDYRHSYDIAVLDHTEDWNINPFLFIEVDGEKHSKKSQKINDGLAEKYVTEVLKKDIIRLSKVECNGKLADRNVYFREKLRKYIK